MILAKYGIIKFKLYLQKIRYEVCGIYAQFRHACISRWDSVLLSMKSSTQICVLFLLVQSHFQLSRYRN